MGIRLYEHNQTAYEAALAMLAEKGRAAVIHPTGTGKSFIGFKLCEDFSDKTICWLSPSEYIFRTQLENWRTAGGEVSRVAAGSTVKGGDERIGAGVTDGVANSATDNSANVGMALSAPANIRFLTYARLMLMQEDELAKIEPDYIILDEFHRCGAKMWGQGVQRLLAQYPEVPVLGLSATNIRYLDGQRDMADELFDGNIASEMTLGDAIVRGILNPPKYVLSVYSCQKELERYRTRAKNAKSKAVRTEAEKYLEALRRALEKADGLDEVFRKYMTEPADSCEEPLPEKSRRLRDVRQTEDTGQQERAGHYMESGQIQKISQPEDCRHSKRYGKYLVFCANYEHMQEMIDKAPEWFAKVDPQPHVYSVYSEDAQAEAEFEKFKADESSHLKLLFCIDMLNEGIHVDNISGVILLRPTVSPVIYKQQIGRALSAGKKQGENAVIFDVVMNIDNLYSIGTVEEEMQVAVHYYRERGEGSFIVNEHFRITDEVKDCLRLFGKLNETLGASWELMYQAAERYYKKYGNLEVTKRYVTEDGLSLGQWLDTQRKVRAGKVGGVLTERQVMRLDQLGMRWKSRNDQNWERNFAAAQAYYREHGDLLVNVRDGKYGGVNLGKWLTQLRTYRKSGIRSGYLTPERVKAMEEIGMVWDVPDYLWEQNYHAAVQYYREYGNLDVPYYYVSPEGVKLGVWIANTRFARRTEGTGRAELSGEQIARLDALGMIWENKNNAVWERSYLAACRYRKKYGNLNIPVAYVTEDGCHLGRWIRKQKETYHSGMGEERRRKLEALGMK